MGKLSSLKDGGAVKRAMQEFDDLGRDEFLARYGYGRAREYLLVVGGKRYDSKAIAGVALKYQAGAGQPLKSADFSGGLKTVAAKLEDLGFRVEKIGSGNSSRGTGT